MSWGWGDFGDYVSVAEKRRRAEAMARKLEKQGRKLLPVKLTGRAIAASFWGKAWCQNLESYSDYESRLPRGRSYVRNGSVLDLQIQRGAIAALVGGTELYDIRIKIDPLGPAAWRDLKRECAGKVGSLIDLLRGKLSGPVMEIITRKGGGLFPKPGEIRLDCSCPDWADLCKHVAASLYAVGARLDESPELLFVLRGVDHLELIAETTQNLAADLTANADSPDTLDESSLAEVFGIELESAEPAPTPVPKATKPKARPAAPKTPAKTQKAKSPGASSSKRSVVKSAGKTTIGTTKAKKTSQTKSSIVTASKKKPSPRPRSKRK